MSAAAALPLADAWGMHGDIGAGWWIVMIAAMVLFWGAIVVAIVWFSRGAAHSWPGRRESPVDILERRFAEGVISPEDYQARREVLANGGEPNGAPHREQRLAGRPGGASQR